MSDVDEVDLPLEYLRLLQQRLPEHFAGLVVRLELQLSPERKAALRERVLELGDKR